MTSNEAWMVRIGQRVCKMSQNGDAVTLVEGVVTDDGRNVLVDWDDGYSTCYSHDEMGDIEKV